MVENDVWPCASLVSRDAGLFVLAFMVRATDYDTALGKAMRVAKAHAKATGGTFRHVKVNDVPGENAVVNPDKPMDIREDG